MECLYLGSRFFYIDDLELVAHDAGDAKLQIAGVAGIACHPATTLTLDLLPSPMQHVTGTNTYQDRSSSLTERHPGNGIDLAKVCEQDTLHLSRRV
jgi:hypothetical protein